MVDRNLTLLLPQLLLARIQLAVDPRRLSDDHGAVPGKDKNVESQSAKSTTYLVHRIDMDFFQPTKRIGIEGIQAYSGYHNYYTRGKRIEKVPHYQSVLYTNVWNQIDMSYDAGSNGNQIKYEFRLHKGSKLSDIQFEVKDSTY